MAAEQFERLRPRLYLIRVVNGRLIGPPGAQAPVLVFRNETTAIWEARFQAYSRVDIVADQTPVLGAFRGWNGLTSAIRYPSHSSTFLLMPAKNGTITAMYDRS